MQHPLEAALGEPWCRALRLPLPRAQSPVLVVPARPPRLIHHLPPLGLSRLSELQEKEFNMSHPHFPLAHSLSFISGQPEHAKVQVQPSDRWQEQQLWLTREMLHRREGDTGTKMQQLSPRSGSSSDCSKIQLNLRIWRWMDIPDTHLATSPLLFRSREFNFKVQ